MRCRGPGFTVSLVELDGYWVARSKAERRHSDWRAAEPWASERPQPTPRGSAATAVPVSVMEPMDVGVLTATSAAACLTRTRARLGLQHGSEAGVRSRSITQTGIAPNHPLSPAEARGFLAGERRQANIPWQIDPLQQQGCARGRLPGDRTAPEPPDVAGQAAGLPRRRAPGGIGIPALVSGAAMDG